MAGGGCVWQKCDAGAAGVRKTCCVQPRGCSNLSPSAASPITGCLRGNHQHIPTDWSSVLYPSACGAKAEVTLGISVQLPVLAVFCCLNPGEDPGVVYLCEKSATVVGAGSQQLQLMDFWGMVPEFCQS